MAEAKKSRKKTDEKATIDNLGAGLGNKPPQAVDFEEAVLGALLIDPRCVDDVMEELKPNCFYEPKNRTIFEAMAKLVNEHIALDLLSVGEKLKAMGKLDEVGGTLALVSLTEKIAAAAHVEYYVKVLKQKCIQRELISAAYDILKGSFDDGADVDELIDMSQSKIDDAIRSNVKRDFQDIGSVIKAATDELEEL